MIGPGFGLRALICCGDWRMGGMADLRHGPAVVTLLEDERLSRASENLLALMRFRFCPVGVGVGVGAAQNSIRKRSSFSGTDQP
jgi:hypothetical protein